MSRILIVYATRHGQTRKIADRLVTILRGDGHSADLVDASVPLERSIVGYDAYLLSASINFGKHQPSMIEFVRDHLYEIESAPSAFLSVSATAASHDEKSLAQAEKCIDEFFEATGWKPTASIPIAGALAYTKYPWIMRIMLKSMVRHSGGEHAGDLDTSRDYEYTDWAALERFATDFVRFNVAKAAAVLL